MCRHKYGIMLRASLYIKWREAIDGAAPLSVCEGEISASSRSQENVLKAIIAHCGIVRRLGCKCPTRDIIMRRALPVLAAFVWRKLLLHLIEASIGYCSHYRSRQCAWHQSSARGNEYCRNAITRKQYAVQECGESEKWRSCRRHFAFFAAAMAALIISMTLAARRGKNDR